MRPAQAPARSSRAAAAASRLAGAAGTLLLQGGFLLLFLSSMPVLRPPAPLERELAILMPRLRPAPPLPAPTGPGTGTVRVTPSLPSIPGPLFTAPEPPATSLPGLQGFGQALNNCAPENYARLAPEQRAPCARPGGDVPAQQGMNLFPRNEAKDEAIWQEEWSEKHWKPGLCDPGQESSVALCLMHQSIAEYERQEDVWYHIDKAKAAALRPPERILPGSKAPPR